MGQIIEPSYYVKPDSLGGVGDLNTTSAVSFGIVETKGCRHISFTMYAPAGTSRSHTLILYGTDDPRAAKDKQALFRDSSYSVTAKWQAMTLPDGSVHLEDQTGFSITLPATDLALGAAEGLCVVNLENPPAYLEWRLVAGGTAPTDGNDDLSIWKSGKD